LDTSGRFDYQEVAMNEKLNSTRRNLDKAVRDLQSTLLDVRDIVPKVEVVLGHPRLHPAWEEVYYSGVVGKRWDAFVKACPEAASKVLPLRNAVLELSEAYKAARDEEKAALNERRRARIAKAALKSAQPHADLKPENKNAAVNYEVLNASLEAPRAAYVAEYVRHAEASLVRRQEQAKTLIEANKGLTTNRAFRIVQDCERLLATVFDPARAAADGQLCFSSYLAKLANKIEARVTKAELVGRLWDGSKLLVETHSGPQVWKTRCILNFSCLGKAFNQWPTRRVS
jgi:hypothetical protein